MQEIINILPKIAIWIQEILQTDNSQQNIWTTTNKSWDSQVPLDVMSDSYIFQTLSQLDCIHKIVSEERENIDIINEKWEYSIAYDPLDWSSLVDVNVSVGTIFWIYKWEFQAKNLVWASYIIYGPRLEIVYTVENKVMYLQKLWENFVEKSFSNLLNKWNIISPGGLRNRWKNYHKDLINNFYSKEYTLRYSWAMIVELHHLLLKWGWLHSYPELDWKPNWKLRKLFEVFPLALLFEKLWWEAIDKNGTRILDLHCNSIHEPTSCYFGSKYEIEKVRKFLPSFSQ